MTKVIAKPRRGGKTTELIKLCADFDGYIVCRDMDTCSRIHDMAFKMNIQINFPICYDEFRKGQYHPSGVKKFLFDDVDHFVQSMTPVPIVAMSLTTDES